MRARLRRNRAGRPNPTRADWIGAAIVLTAGASAIIFRQMTIVPREFVGLCASPSAPLICAPRQAVLWLQYEHWFGFGALLLGLLAFAFARRPLGIAALALGCVAVVNYNATEGIIGAALGLWGWLEMIFPRDPEIPEKESNAP